MIDSYKTLTGIPVLEAFRRLDAELEPHAYKPISGGKGERLGLTDISPAYLPQALLEVFGPLGLGWSYNIGLIAATLGKDAKGNDRWDARAEVSVVWAYIDEKGELCRSQSIQAPGGSDNSEREWAEKGAITNALGTAWFFAGWQLSVYQGKRSHQTVRQQPPQKPQKPAGGPAQVFVGKESQDKIKAALAPLTSREAKLTLLRAATQRPDLSGLLEVLESDVPAILEAAGKLAAGGQA